MKGDEKVIEYLNKALRHELTAVNQYWLHYRLLDDWGFSLLARKEREESLEEMRHADLLVERILFLEGFPNLQTLDPLRIGQSLKEVIEADLAGEYVARALYQEAREICHIAQDYVTQNLFEKLMGDEEDHIDYLETQLQLIEQIGIERYGMLQALPADAAE